MSRLTANCLLLLAGLVWGLGFVAQETAMDNVGPFQFIALRFCLAALVVWPFALRETKALQRVGQLIAFTPSQWRAIVVVGSVFFGGMAFQQVGLLGTSVTNAGMLTGLYVILVPIIAFTILRERQTLTIWAAAATAFAGVWFLGGGGIGKFTWGDVLMIFCALFWAIHVIIIGRAVGSMGRPVAIACIQFAVCGALGCLGFFIARLIDWSLEPVYSHADLIAAAPEILYAAIIAGGFAFTLQAIGQRYTRAADAAVLLSSESLFAALGGAVILGERLDLYGYLGCALLLAAIVVVSVVAARAEAAKERAVI